MFIRLHQVNSADPPFTTFCNTLNSKFLEDNESYISTSPLKIYCGTYNVNGKVEDDEHR